MRRTHGLVKHAASEVHLPIGHGPEVVLVRWRPSTPAADRLALEVEQAATTSIALVLGNFEEAIWKTFQ